MERILIKKQDSLYFFLILIKMVPMLIPDVYGDIAAIRCEVFILTVLQMMIMLYWKRLEYNQTTS